MSCQVVKIENSQSVNSTQTKAVEEATRCLAASGCADCELCRYFCPDLCISRHQETGQIQIDYAFCKGCGICAFICPKGAITMERETN